MPYDPTREMAYKAQTSTNLYTNHLSAMVVLVELSELTRSRDQQGTSLGWRQYKTGKGSNKGTCVHLLLSENTPSHIDYCRTNSSL